MKLPNGYGSVYKLSGNRRKPWIAVKTIGRLDTGSQVYQTIGYYETREKGLQALAIFNENPYTIEVARITAEQVYEKWKKHAYPKLAQKTQNGYDLAWRYSKDIAHLPFMDITLNHLQTIVDNMGNKWAIKKLFKTFWKVLYDYAIKTDLCNKNYGSYIEIGNKITKIPRIPFTVEEKQTLWENLNRIDFIDTILILIYTGLRISELLNMKIKDVHLKESYMQGGIKTEAGKDRIIPIHSRILPLVKRWYDKAVLVGSETLIFNEENKPIKYGTYYSSIWQFIFYKLKFTITHRPHDTRHTFATDMDNKKVNKLCTKKIMGHSTGYKDVTEVYTHKYIKELLEAVELLD